MITEARLEADLPERFAVLYDYHTGRFQTPLDDRGIADVDAIFELALRTYPDPLPSFDTENIHHIYWTEAWWARFARRHQGEDRDTIIEFHDSAPQKMYLPIPLHHWVERVMVRPPAPSLEVMRRRNASWRIASMLLDGARVLDKAWENFDEHQDSTRRVIGYIPGVSPTSRRGEVAGERTNRDYWFSELENHLRGWRDLTIHVDDEIPEQDRLITATMYDARELRKRTRDKRAMVPQAPATLLVA